MEIIKENDTWLAGLVAGVLREPEIAGWAVLKCGENYNVWGHNDPQPYELIDDAGQVVWTEGVR